MIEVFFNLTPHTTPNHTALSVSLGREKLGMVDQEYEAGEVNDKQ